jgi:hypothetical protein
VGSVLINEVVTDPQQDWNDSAGGNGVPFDAIPGNGTVSSTDEWVELLNTRGTTLNLTGWRLAMMDTSPATEVLGSGSAVLRFSAGGSLSNFQPGERLVIGNPTGTMNNDVYLQLWDASGTLIDDVEIGFDLEGDGDDGVPEPGQDGNATGPDDEAIARVPDGIDTGNDGQDFCQQGATIGSDNGSVCPSRRLLVPVLQTDDGWETWVHVQNAGLAATKAVLVLWGDYSAQCPPQCAPRQFEVSGLIPPGAAWAWHFTGPMIDCHGDAFLPHSGIVYSGDPADVDDLKCTGTWLREAPFIPPVGKGAPITVVVRRVQSGASGQVPSTSSYTGIAATEAGRDARTGAFLYHLPLLWGDFHDWRSTVYVQNGGTECTSVEVWWQEQQSCRSAVSTQVLALCPGESVALWPPDGWGRLGSGWVRATQPLAIVADEQAASGGLLLSYQGVNAQTWNVGMPPDANTGPRFNLAPLIYREFNGWNTGLQVQNLSGVYNALVKVYFLDNSGDVIETIVDWICPRGAQTFYLPAINNLPGQYVGWARVESQNWWGPGDPPVDAPYIQSVVNLVNYGTGQGLAYNALPARWGGGESGWQVLGLPRLVKDQREALEPISAGWSSEIAVANLNLEPNVTVFRLDFFDQNGLLYSLCQTINEKQVDYVKLANIGIIPAGWSGSAVLSVQCGPGVLGAVAVERVSGYVSGDLTAGYEALPLPAALLRAYRDPGRFSPCPACP